MNLRLYNWISKLWLESILFWHLLRNSDCKLTVSHVVKNASVVAASAAAAAAPSFRFAARHSIGVATWEFVARAVHRNNSDLKKPSEGAYSFSSHLKNLWKLKSKYFWSSIVSRLVNSASTAKSDRSGFWQFKCNHQLSAAPKFQLTTMSKLNWISNKCSRIWRKIQENSVSR